MADETTSPPPVSADAASGAATPRMAPLAIVSVVLGVLSFLFVPIILVIPAIVCGHLAWSRISKSGGALYGKGIAIVGLVVGYLAIPWAVLQTWFLVSMFQADSHRLHDLAIQKKEIASDDNKLKITTTGFWVGRTDLNKRASLQAADPHKELYVIVLSDPKSAADETLQQHHQMTRAHMSQDMTNSSATEPVSVTIDGHPALQDEVNGTRNGAILTFLHTTVDDGDSFRQILAWTLKSRWAANKSELAEVTASFHSER